MNRFAPVVLAAFGLSACVTQYAETPEETSHAVLNFVNEPKLATRGFSGLPLRVEQKYVSVADRSCSKPTEITHFTRTSKDHRPVRVKPDQTINVLAYNLYGGASNISDVRPGHKSENCNSIASFTPKKDGNYIVRMKQTEHETCEIFVVDYATKKAPSDLTIKNRFECEQ